MLTPSALLARLTDIGRSLERSGHALALIGLGSVGLELERLDAYSDLDFFAIVEDGYKSRYLDNLDWLSSLCPVAYHFRNTPDGYKLLFHDGIFCEFAVFEPGELSAMLFTHGRIIWKRPQIEETIGAPTVRPASTPPPEADWLVNEALTNLYVGLGRFRRGERLSAARFIQHYAVDRLVALAATIERTTQTVNRIKPIQNSGMISHPQAPIVPPPQLLIIQPPCPNIETSETNPLLVFITLLMQRGYVFS